MRTGLNRLTGVPWHIERWHRSEGDPKRHCHRCVFFRNNDKFCTKTLVKCYGSAHCEHYSETAVSAVKKTPDTLNSLFNEKPKGKTPAAGKKKSAELANEARNSYSNFAFISNLDPELEKLGRDAEFYLGNDANVAVYKIGYLGEKIVNDIFLKENIEFMKSERQVDSINTLYENRYLPSYAVKALTDIRIGRNKAVHENDDSSENARRLLREAFELCCWYMKEYGSKNFDPSQIEYIEPYYDKTRFDKAVSYTLPKDVLNAINHTGSTDETLRINERNTEDIEQTAANIINPVPDFSLNDAVVIEIRSVPFLDSKTHIAIDEIYIENNSDTVLRNVDIEIIAIPSISLPYIKKIAQISPHKGIVQRNIDITVDPDEVEHLSGSTYLYLSIVLKDGQKVITEERADLAVSDEVQEIIGSINDISYGHSDEQNINPVLEEKSSRIYIPCGLGNSDNGFFIHGIKKAQLCTYPHAEIYALVYNYMIRQTKMDPNEMPELLKKEQTAFVIEYKVIYRLVLILLQMIKNNYVRNDTLKINYVGNREDLELAVKLIGDYADRFARLLHLNYRKVRIISAADGYQVSIASRAEIYVSNNTELDTIAREMWFGRKLRYHLGKEDIDDLLYILHEISDFEVFREGQFEALSQMLSTDKNAVSILPTGSGKSLIFYLASLLQPLPVMIVEPTDILIEDQIRNLNEIHHIDNAAHLKLTEDFDFEGFDIHNNINYMTPETMTNRNLFSSFIHKFNIGENLKSERISPGPMMSYFILDEIHCISNWGHDFRPEYLMISGNLNKYLDHVQILGFTGTANFTVVEDIQKQLSVPTENFISPIQFEKYNVTYDFRECSNEEEMFAELLSIVSDCDGRMERTIIFTKNDDVTEKLAERLDGVAMPFREDDSKAYTEFVNGYVNTLITTELLGIGINFPNIKNIIHFGLPLSKNEYVQEVGRAGRSNERVRSYVLFLSDIPKNVPDSLLGRNIDLSKVRRVLEEYDNDYADIFGKLTGGILDSEQLLERLLDLKRNLLDHFGTSFLLEYPKEELTELKRCLYMLYVCGLVEDWFSYGHNDKTDEQQIYVRLPEKRTEEQLRQQMQTKLRAYLTSLGQENRTEVVKTALAKKSDDIIRIYVNWYFDKYLYRHNEEFVDLYEFITGSVGQRAEKITDKIKDYFALPFTAMLDEENEYNAMDIRQILEKSAMGFSSSTLANVARINSYQYSPKLDFLLLCGELRTYGRFSRDRLNRVMKETPAEYRETINSLFQKLYPVCDLEGKLNVINYLEEDGKKHGITLDDFLDDVYRNNEKDAIYYGMIAKRINDLFSK